MTGGAGPHVRPPASLYVGTPIASPAHGITATPVAATPRVPVVDPFFGRALTTSESGYVRDFSRWSVARLEKEPKILAAESAQLQREIEELSLRNYPTFLHTNRVLKQADRNLQQIDRSMLQLHTDVLPALQSSCESFVDRSVALMSQSASHRNMVKHHNFLVELLEIPNLMDSCFKAATAHHTTEREKNRLINDALQLDQYVKELIEQQIRSQQNAAAIAVANDPLAVPRAPVVPSILLSIQSEMAGMKRNIVNHLLQQLRGNISATVEEEDIPDGAPTGTKPTFITVPEVVVGIRIVGLLKRTMDMFGPGGTGIDNATAASHQHILLKYQFLLSRNAYFDSAIQSLHAPTLPDAPHATTTNASAHASAASLNLLVFKYLDEYLALHRTNLFNISTLYSALFLDEATAAAAADAQTDSTPHADAEETARKQAEDIGILCRWIHRRIEMMLETLETYLPYLVDGSSFLALLNSSMSCAAGLSRSKVGLDFRPLVVPIFERHIFALFDRTVGAHAAALEQNMRDYAWHIPPAQLSRMGFSVDAKRSPATAAPLDALLTPLLQYPPLAMLANGIVAAINELAKCAPLSIGVQVGAAAERHLDACIQKIKNAQITQLQQVTTSGSVATNTTSTSEDAKEAVTDPLLKLAHGVDEKLLTLVDALIRHVYPEATGLFSLSRLRSSLSVLFEEERIELERRRAAEEESRARAEAEARVRQERAAAEQRVKEAELQRAQEQAIALASPAAATPATAEVALAPVADEPAATAAVPSPASTSGVAFAASVALPATPSSPQQVQAATPTAPTGLAALAAQDPFAQYLEQHPELAEKQQ